MINDEQKVLSTIFSTEAERLRTPLAVFFSILLMAGVVLLMPQSAPADLKSAIQKYNNGQRESALAEMVGLAKAGNSDAKYVLGVIYADGKGTAVDPKKALKWLQEAANERHSNAQFSLGVMHVQGNGVPRDLVRGLMWLNLAAQDTTKGSYHKLRIISVVAGVKKLMTPEQIDQAKERAAKWQPGQP